MGIQEEQLITLIKEFAYRYYPDGIKLSSGKVSKYYFDLKKVSYSPRGQMLIGNLFYDLIMDLNLDTIINSVGGLTMGADPIAIATSADTISAFSIRKETKEHGRRDQIVGCVKKGDKVIIVDDVLTTGSSTIKAIKIAREYGLIVIAVIALLDRCEENGKQNIEALGLSVYSILTINDFKED